jgi:hypothetical protein
MPSARHDADTIALIHREGAHLSPATQEMGQLAKQML